MGELENRLKELLRRTKITTKSRYRASERLERHHKLSQWTVALVSAALVFIPLVQALGVTPDINPALLNAAQATLAVLVLVYSLLLGQENFISRSQAMHRNGIELGRFARKLAGKGDDVPDEEYFALAEEYYDILDKYENHKPIDYLYTWLAKEPTTIGEWPRYAWVWVKSRVVTFFVFSHYFLAMVFVAFVFYALFSGVFIRASGVAP
jgi:hypothetical protein